jgi:XTP/dITP diphosphohydrolase
MTNPKTMLLATNNTGKVGELRALLADLAGIELVTPAEMNLNLDPSETGLTYEENAAIKAVAFSQASDLPALADDSGLEVAALGGAPGLISARFSPKQDATDADRRAYLLSRLVGKPAPWTATFVSVVCLALPNGTARFARGECNGQILSHERGSGGFGYDPIFQVEGMQRTMAELSMAEKNTLSHRARAILAAKDLIRDELGLDG